MIQELGAQFAADIRSLTGSNATWTRNGVFSDEAITLTPGEMTTQAENEDVTVETQTPDFLANVADLTYGDPATTFLPKEGDVIVFNSIKYIVKPPVGMPVFEYRDRWEKTIRIHTVKDGPSA